jgi:hypothetical protein
MTIPMQAAQRQFLFMHLRASGTWQALHTRVQAAMCAPVATDDVQIVGLFMGLFGVASNELVWLLSLPVEVDAIAGVRRLLPADVDVLDALPLRATARPDTDAKLTRAGIYVFRFFEVLERDIDEIVQLSRAAWETFESGANYRAEPIALFRYVVPVAERGRMLLLTWYDNLTSWEHSRTPHPDARANFQRRAALTIRTTAIATRLAETVGRESPDLLSSS